jgi:RES domain-containing protein
MKALEKEQLSQQIGAAWYETRESAVLAVPSTIIRQEFNYLLNPLHPDFARIKVVSVEPYHFDARLWKQAGGRS